MWKNAVLWILGLSNGSSTDRKWWLASQTNILCPWLSCFVLQHPCVLLPQLQWVPSCLFGATRSFPDITTVESAGDGSTFKTVRWGPWQKPKSQCSGLPIVPGLVPWVWQEWQLCPLHPGAVHLQEVTWQMPGSSQPLVPATWVTLTRHLVRNDKGKKWSDVEQKEQGSSPSSAT